MKKVIAAALGLTLLASILAGCGSSAGAESGIIAISGSSAMYPLAKAGAAQFKKDKPDVSVIVSAGGSGVGLNNVLSGTVDIGNSDVYASEKLSASYADKLKGHKVCIIGIAVVVNADTGVANLSKEQLQGIFDGQIANWKEVGGPDEPVTIINRPSSSGTRALFTKWALDGQAGAGGDQALQTDDSNALLTTVSGVKGAIGYVSLSYLTAPNPSIRKVQIDGVDAAYDNIYNGTYPVWGYEHMYTLGEPNALVQAFLDYMTSPGIAAEREAMGYGDVSKLNADAAKSR